MVIIINGAPESGKSTFVKICKEQHLLGFIYEYSTVDFVKQIATECGWDGVKNAKNRKFLSDLKDLLTEWHDIPFRKSIEKVQENYQHSAEIYSISPHHVITFIHCREPEEIQKFKEYYGDDWCRTLLIRRPTVEDNDQSNHADAQVFNYKYDYEIMNDGTLNDLEQKAQDFVEEVWKYRDSHGRWTEFTK